MLQLDFEPQADVPFHASTEPLVGGLRIARCTFSAGFTIRDAELVRNSDDSFGFVICQSKQIAVRKWREFELGKGDAALMRISDPGTLGAAERFGYVALMVPYAELAVRLPNVQELIAERISKNSEGLRLMRAYIGALATDKLPNSAHGRDLVQRHLYDLVALAVEQQRHSVGESGLSAVGAVRLNAALRIIDAQFDQPDLSLAGVAQLMSFTPRYLQRLFQASGKSFSGHVADRRLGRAYELLSNPVNHGRWIADIALQSGFSDISNFNRCFKRHYGFTPSEIRGRRS
jgi:AraC-like DNA-binding protein